MSANQKTTLVLKIGGNQVEDETFLAGFVAAVAGLLAEHSVIIVHGGGKEITDLHAQLGVATETVEGLRATSEESLRLVEMVLNGTVNTRWCAGWWSAGWTRSASAGWTWAWCGSRRSRSLGAAWAAWARSARSTARRCSNCSTWA